MIKCLFYILGMFCLFIHNHKPCRQCHLKKIYITSHRFQGNTVSKKKNKQIIYIKHAVIPKKIVQCTPHELQASFRKLYGMEILWCIRKAGITHNYTV